MELVSHNMDKYKDLERDVVRDQKDIKITRKYTLIFGFTMVLVLVIDNYITRLFTEIEMN